MTAGRVTIRTVTDLKTRPEAIHLPAAVPVVAGACVAIESLQLTVHGSGWVGDARVILSLLLVALASVLVVGWVAAGVLRAHLGFLAAAWALLSLQVGLGGMTFGSAEDVSLWSVTVLAVTVGQVLALAAFTRSDYFRGQRAR